MKRKPFPLDWPAHVEATMAHFRRNSPFRVGFDQARRRLLRELDFLGANHVVLSSDLPLRADGQPYATGGSTNPGIAVWFVHEGKERVFACDCWLTHAENMAALWHTVEALRGLERWGVGEAVERAFAGFAALPPGPSGTIPPAPTKRPWRQVLGTSWPELDNDELLVLAKSRHRKLIAAAHPDAGGDQAAAAELNVAIADAELELGGAA